MNPDMVTRTNANRGQVVSHPVRPRLQFGVRPTFPGANDRNSFGYGISDGFEQVCKAGNDNELAPPTSSTPAQKTPAATSAPATTTSAPSSETATTSSASQETSAGKKIPYTGLPTENPNATIVPGEMRSDREELPEGFTKEEADRAEIREYELQQRQSAVARGPAPGPGQQYWPSDKWVCGAIRDKYNSLGAQFSFLLWPTSDELTAPDGHGKFSTFQNGPIYWSAAGGAHPVVNHFLAKWGNHGYEGGFIGYPKTDEIVLADGVGRRQEFMGADIYFFPLTGANVIGGLIRDKWVAQGAQAGPLGYPTSDETGVTKYNGRFNNFQWGAIYWSSQTQAHSLSLDILTVWRSRGAEAGRHGFPTSDTYGQPQGWVAQDFELDRISYYLPF